MSRKEWDVQKVIELRVDELPGPVALLSSERFRIIYISNDFRTYLSSAYRDMDLVGTSVFDVLRDEENNPVVPILKRISRTGKGEEIRDFSVTNRDGYSFLGRLGRLPC